MPSQSLCLIYNPAAANGRTAQLAPRVVRVLAQAGYTVTTLATTAPGSAAGQVREALQAGCRTFAVLGGDGTLHDAVNGFFVEGKPTHPDARLAILQAGTGGDFARTLGLPRNPLEGAASLPNARPCAVDVGILRCLDLDGRPKTEAFINIANVGLAGDVVARVNRASKAFGGFVSFLIGTVASILNSRPLPMTLRWDDGPECHGRFHMVTIGNGRFFGGGMAACPGAGVADGHFDLMTLGDLSRWTFLASMPKVYTGTHLGLPGVEHRLGRTLQVTAPAPVWVEADGELIGTTPLQVDLLPGALTLLL
jgi:YegS/Rv2252/BmrU family lipid kinase